jgi:hypothetical protein
MTKPTTNRAVFLDRDGRHALADGKTKPDHVAADWILSRG